MASRNMSGRPCDWLGRFGRLGQFDHATTCQVNDPIGDRRGTLELVRGKHDGTAGRPRPGKEPVEKITSVLIKSRMGLVEQPEPRTSCYEHRK
jgi:hypothetical protein